MIGFQEGSHERWEFLAWTQRMSTPSLPSSKSFLGTFTNFARLHFNAIFRRPWSSDMCFVFFQVVGIILTCCIEMCILHRYILVEAFVRYPSSSVTGPLWLRHLWSLPWCWPALLGRMKGWVNILHLLVSFWQNDSVHITWSSHSHMRYSSVSQNRGLQWVPGWYICWMHRW